MSLPVYVLGEALMDCVAQPDGSLRPHMGGSPFNMARAAALRGASVQFLNPFSTDRFGDQMLGQLREDGVEVASPRSALPTSLAVVQIHQGQPSYGFYREGIADRSYDVDDILAVLSQQSPAILHTGSLMLVPPEHERVLAILTQARRWGWTISVDVNLRPKLASDLRVYIDAVKSVAALAHWLKASDEDLALLGSTHPQRNRSAEAAAPYLAAGTRRLALTFGGQGAWLSVDGAQAQRDVPLVEVVDTVGAGDVFWGNCVADWAQDADVSEQAAAARVASTLDMAMQAAAINCTRAGCQPPTAKETRDAMELRLPA